MEDYNEFENSSFLFKLRVVLIAGAGFFTDAYDLFTINYVAPMLGYVYYWNNPGHALPSVYDSLIKASTSWGNLVGQLFFGWLSDKYGRKKIYGSELVIMIVATLGSTLAADTPAGLQAIAMLGFWRFILGVGIGGDYPQSSVYTSENASVAHRGRMIALVFGMQGIGMVASALTALVVLNILKDPINSDRINVDYLWRICIGMGIVPAVIVLYYRLTIKESPRYAQVIKAREAREARERLDAQRMSDDENGLTQNMLPQEVGSQQSNDIPIVMASDSISLWEFISKWHNFKVLLGTSMSWFALDVAFYGANLNQSYVIETIGFTGNGSLFEKLQLLILGNLMITFLGTLPGYYFTAYFVDKWGRKPIQYMGFIVSGTCWIILAAAYDQLSTNYTSAFIVIYVIAMFFLNFGPNSTTFIVPGECFPTKFRSTCHGISAAVGKAGAILAAEGFSLLKDHIGVASLLYIFGAFMFVGVGFTTLLFETKGKSLEELEKNFVYPEKKKVVEWQKGKDSL